MIQFIKFSIVGVSNTLITILIYNLLRHFNVGINAANVIGYSVGTLNSYIWNRNWVFSTKGKQSKLIVKFIIVNLITLAFNTAAMNVLVHNFSINDRLAQLAATSLGMIINYVLNKLWTFKTETSAKAETAGTSENLKED